MAWLVTVSWVSCKQSKLFVTYFGDTTMHSTDGQSAMYNNASYWESCIITQYIGTNNLLSNK